MAEALFSFRSHSIRPTHEARRWIVTPICLSLLFHLFLLTAVESTSWPEMSELDREVERIFSIETETVRPEDLERVVMVPGMSSDELAAVDSPEKLTADMFAARPGDVPRPHEPKAKSVPRYPEEELPLVSEPGLSQRSHAFVRDGELGVVDPGEARILSLPPGRRIVDTITAGPFPEPTLRDTSDELVKSIPRREPEFLADRAAPPLGLRPPSPQAVPAELETAELDRDAELLYADEGPPVPTTPLPLDVKIDVYAEPGDRFRFFRMTVTEREKLKLPVIAKNVLFVVDISSSIRLDMLNSVREAIAKAAKGLNEGDKFNVVRFSEKYYKVFDDFVPATPENIAEAARWIRKEPGQVRTDVYTALKEVIAGLATEGEDARRPANTILISDGNPTTGIHDIRHIVNDLSAVTRSNDSIFAVNPGAQTANAYLLDLLAYRNRGLFVQAKKPEETAGEILGLLARFKDPVLINLRAQYGNFEVDQVYPNTLPNLYSGHSIVIYGRCLPGETIAVRIIGDGAEGRRKFLWTSTLPEVLTEEKTIAREWARGKIHYLTSLIARDGEKQEYLDEMHRLSEEYGLASPYD